MLVMWVKVVVFYRFVFVWIFVRENGFCVGMVGRGFVNGGGWGYMWRG